MGLVELQDAARAYPQEALEVLVVLVGEPCDLAVGAAGGGALREGWGDAGAGGVGRGGFGKQQSVAEVFLEGWAGWHFGGIGFCFIGSGFCFVAPSLVLVRLQKGCRRVSRLVGKRLSFHFSNGRSRIQVAVVGQDKGTKAM